MALVASWEEAGDGIIVSENIYTREYTVEENGILVTLRETSTTEERVWHGLSETAAEEAVAQALQPAQIGATYSYIARVENQAIRSFEVRRIYELKTTVTL